VCLATQNKEVNLLKRVKTEDGWLFWPVPLTSRGQVRAETVLVRGQEERHSEGTYYIGYRQNGKRIRENAGRNALEAHNRRLAKEAELSAIHAGVPVLAQMGNGDGRITLTAAVGAYLEEIKLTKKPKTLAAYSTALAYFQESCHKLYVSDIERKDMLKFAAFLREQKGQSPRSCWNKFSNVMTFLKAQGIRGLMKKNDWPRFTEEEPEVYEKEGLEGLFAACDDDERIWYEFFLMTGMREQEVMYAYWSDINLQHATVRVTHKPDRGWTPKAYKEREIPIPVKLVKMLRERKAKHDKKCNLVFPTAGCRPKLDFLDCLKAVAERAGLDSDNFWLHKFRATFATRLLQSGKVDVRTVQKYLGHTDLESTLRYLKPARNATVTAKLDEIWA
jgi:integrase/recombinase XerD